MTKPLNTPGPPAGQIRISYRELAPLEEGGRTAREGFDYQDHVAVNKCLDMLLREEIAEVWCEAEDDIVLVWSENGVEEFEFVQVKRTDLKQAWTVARLCAFEGGKRFSSIYAKSLAHDRGLEPCRFRVVTLWGPDGVLDVLLMPRGKRDGDKAISQLKKASNEITSASDAIVSQNGNGSTFWTERTEWEHRASPRDVKNDNLVKLSLLLEKQGVHLATDQSEELHAVLVGMVQNASLANGVTEKETKRLRRDDLRARVLDRADKIQHPTHSGASGPLRRKLEEAGMDSGGIERAEHLRLRYAKEAREPRYLTLDDRETLHDEVLATLNLLKARLDAGELNDTALQFLSRCLQNLNGLHGRLGKKRCLDSLLHGCMYEVMNRCMHRLVPVSP